MKAFEKTYKFEIDNISNFEAKLKSYFENDNFKINKIDNQHFNIRKSGGLFAGWKLNPLSWETNIDMQLKNEKVKINYKTDGLYLTPIAFTDLYNSYINNFKSYLSSNKSYKTENEKNIGDAKKKALLYSVIFFLITIVIILLSNYVTIIIKNRIIGLVFIGVCVKITESLMNGYLEKKYGES